MSEIAGNEGRAFTNAGGELVGEGKSTELSMRRTGMSFQRTRMSADRTLMAVIKTSLSLISFGFTIYQFFHSLREAGAVSGASGNSPRNFGATLIVLGVATLIVGIGYHVSLMWALRKEREQMTAKGLIHGESPYPVSATLIVAFLLLAIGFVALYGVVVRTGPFFE